MFQRHTWRMSTQTTNHRFLLLGEPIALDLVNTRIRRDGEDVDTLATCAALTAWLRAERARVAWAGAVTGADLVAVRGLRDAIDSLLRARRAGTQPAQSAIARINRALASNATASRLRWTASGPALAPPPACARRHALLHALASSAVELLTRAPTDRVRECAHPDCRLQFLALNPRRRWCSSATCGNRARVAQHYQRHHRPL